MTEKENARQPKSTSARTENKFTDNSAEGQRARLLEALKRGPMTTLEIRQDLDILMPAARIFELRHDEDQDITMHWVTRHTAAGNPHRVALYAFNPASPRPVQITLDLVPPSMDAIAI